jgi:hypothetical protein
MFNSMLQHQQPNAKRNRQPVWYFNCGQAPSFCAAEISEAAEENT